MGRLIDADKLKHVIHCAYSDDLEILEKIDEQPTAFDVDRVLGKMHDEMMNSASSEFDYAMYRAIEIVKGGGVDGN